MDIKQLFRKSFDAHLRYVIPKEYTQKQALYIAKGYDRVIGRLNEMSYNQFKVWLPKGYEEAEKLQMKNHLFFSSRKNYMISFKIAKMIIKSFDNRGF